MHHPLNGLFIGLTTLDLIYLVEAPPDRNQKIVAQHYSLAAGGPATNAAVTFQYLGSQATVLGAIGSHPLSQLILADLQQCGVAIADLSPDRTDPPATSSILVTQATGERAVVSLNAVKSQINRTAIPDEIFQQITDRNFDIILIDGHQIEVGKAIAQHAQTQGIPIAIDGGSWKPGFEEILPYVTYAICSANFLPPNCSTTTEVVKYLTGFGISHIALTQGEKSVLYWSDRTSGEIPVPPIQPVDTLGAGDIFHGAFCHYVGQFSFVEALTQAGAIASQSCQSFGTRHWMNGQRS